MYAIHIEIHLKFTKIWNLKKIYHPKNGRQHLRAHRDSEVEMRRSPQLVLTVLAQKKAPAHRYNEKSIIMQKCETYFNIVLGERERLFFVCGCAEAIQTHVNYDGTGQRKKKRYKNSEGNTFTLSSVKNLSFTLCVQCVLLGLIIQWKCS